MARTAKGRRFSVRMTARMRKAIAREAARSGRSLSDELVRLLDEAMALRMVADSLADYPSRKDPNK